MAEGESLVGVGVNPNEIRDCLATLEAEFQSFRADDVESLGHGEFSSAWCPQPGSMRFREHSHMLGTLRPVLWGLWEG